ncbi:hypothetical protein ScPMuIL_002130, partial [Solemya velum]
AFEKRYSEAPQSTPNAQGAGSVNFPDKMDNPLKLIETAPRSANSIQAMNVLFVCARVGSQKLRFLVDTGSDVTVISVQEFETIFNHNTITLSKEDTSFKTANGEYLQIAGTCKINLRIGSCVYPHKVLVANIAEKAILGNDFLRQNRVVIDLSRNKLKIGTNTVQLYCDEGSFQCCKVTAARNFVIPPESEVVVEGLMHKRGSPFCEGVVESVSQLRQNHPQLMVAKTLVDCELSRKVPVRLLNITSEPAIVQEGSRIGMLYPVQNEIHSVPNLINRTRGNVPTDKEQVVEDLLLKNKQVFVGSDEKLGRCNLYEHEIETGSALPIKQRAYRLPVHKREEVDKQVESMLEQGIVSPSLSPWASPIVLVEKKHDTHKSYRFCVDYRKLNKVTKVDAYPLPRIDDTIDVLSGSQYFSTLDLASGFWQMGLSEKAKEKTAFTTDMAYITSMSYHLVYHMDRIQQVLDCLHEAGLKLKPQNDHSSGAILSQLHEGEEKVISYYSTTHSAPERKYSVTRKELLAVIKAIKHFRHYLYGREFVLRTDHASLRWLMGFKEPQGQIARWLEFLSSYQFTIEHRILTLAHDSTTGGHFGIKKTRDKIRQIFYWLGMREDVTDWIKTCTMCQTRKSPVPKFRAPLVNIQSSEPMEIVAIDITGPFPVTSRDNKYILVVGDLYSKWIESYPIPDQEAKTVAQVLTYKFFTRFGVPKQLHSDQGGNFESKLFKELCSLLGINKTRTTAYRPESDGMIERFNRTMKNILSKYVQADQSDWDLHLPTVTMAYRSSIHETTGVTPNFMML